MIRLRVFIRELLIPLGVGLAAGLLTRRSVESYALLERPALSPPAILFPVVWTVLYILMGISAYLIVQQDSPESRAARIAYGVQLVLNFFWPLIFFNGQWFLLAFVWILLLWAAILVMIVLFNRVSPLAAKLQIPYLLWVTFAAYLNLSVWLLNR